LCLAVATYFSSCLKFIRLSCSRRSAVLFFGAGFLVSTRFAKFEMYSTHATEVVATEETVTPTQQPNAPFQTETANMVLLLPLTTMSLGILPLYAGEMTTRR
jgi:hypothetical protein